MGHIVFSLRYLVILICKTKVITPFILFKWKYSRRVQGIINNSLGNNLLFTLFHYAIRPMHLKCFKIVKKKKRSSKVVSTSFVRSYREEGEEVRCLVTC